MALQACRTPRRDDGQISDMLKEIHGLADDPPARRRWFHDDYFDLFVWQAAGEVTLFQLCYGVDSSERALVWDHARGFFHDGPPASRDDVSRLEEAATALPPELSSAIREKIHEFAGRAIAVTSRRKTFRRAAWQS
jgi:hypothetical protein